ncbi:MAG: hypothetical protein RL318_2883 [Fibrobacterota bacterium]
MPRFGMAGRRADGAFHGFHDIPQGEVLRKIGKGNTSPRTSDRLHKSGFRQPADDASHKGNGEMPRLRHPGDGDPGPLVLAGKMKNDAHRIVGLSMDGKH